MTLSHSTLVTICEYSQLFVLLPFLVGAGRFFQQDVVYKLLIGLIFSAIIISGLAYLLYAQGTNNMPLLHLYTILEGSFWCAIYYQRFHHSSIRKILLCSVIGFVILCLINICFFQNLEQYNSYSRSLEAVLLCALALYWFYYRMVASTDSSSKHSSFFLINTAVLIYFAGAFLLFVFNNFMIVLGRQHVLEAWAIHGIFLSIHYLLISIGLWRYQD